MLYVCIRKLREAKPACECCIVLLPIRILHTQQSTRTRTPHLAYPTIVLFLLAFAIFAGGQVILFLASQSLCTVSSVIPAFYHPLHSPLFTYVQPAWVDFVHSQIYCCVNRGTGMPLIGLTDDQASGRKINGAFLAAFLDTLALSVVYLAWVVSPSFASVPLVSLPNSP